MFNVLLNYVTDSSKTALTSITGATVGAFAQVPTIQIIGGYIAAIAGLMTIINLFFPLRYFYDNYKAKKNVKKAD